MWIFVKNDRCDRQQKAWKILQDVKWGVINYSTFETLIFNMNREGWTYYSPVWRILY